MLGICLFLSDRTGIEFAKCCFPSFDTFRLVSQSSFLFFVLDCSESSWPISLTSSDIVSELMLWHFLNVIRLMYLLYVLKWFVVHFLHVFLRKRLIFVWLPCQTIFVSCWEIHTCVPVFASDYIKFNFRNKRSVDLLREIYFYVFFAVELLHIVLTSRWGHVYSLIFFDFVDKIELFEYCRWFLLLRQVFCLDKRWLFCILNTKWATLKLCVFGYKRWTLFISFIIATISRIFRL